MVLQGELTPEQIGVKVAEWRRQQSQAGTTPQVDPRGITRTGTLASGAEDIQADDPVVARGRSFAGSIPPLASIAGQIVGSAAGPVGEVAGGALGGGGGDALRQMIQDPTRRDIDTGSVATEAGLGGGAGALGLGIGRVARGRRLTPEQSRDIAVLERENIPYTAGDVRPEGFAQQAENLMRGTAFGGGVMNRSAQEQARAVAQFRERVLDRIGPLLSNDEVGQATIAAIERRSESLFGGGGTFQKLYQRLTRLFPAKVRDSEIRRDIRGIKAKLEHDLRLTPKFKPTDSGSAFLGLLDDLSNVGVPPMVERPSAATTSLGGPTGMTRPVTTATVTPTVQPLMEKTADLSRLDRITYADIWEVKKNLDSVIRGMSATDPLRTRAKAVAAEIHTVLDSAMERSAQNVSPLAAKKIREINTSYSEAKRLFEKEGVVPMLRRLEDPEKAVGVAAPRGAVTRPGELFKALGPEESTIGPQFRRRYIQNQIEGITKEFEGVEVVSGKRFGDKLRAMRSTLESLKMPKDQMAALDEFIDAASRAQNSLNITNPASGRQLFAASQFAALGAGGFAVLGGDPGRGAAAGLLYVASPAILARALTNPRIARFLAKGFTLKPGTQEAAKWTPQALNLLRGLEGDNGE